MTFDIWSFTLGALLGMIGLAVAYMQWKHTKEVERLRREQLLAAINRAKFMLIPKAVIEKILEKGNPESGETLRQWLWSLHRRIYPATH